MGFLQGKRALVTGIASQRSIATGIAEAMHRQGAELALTYQNEKLKSRVESAADEYGSKIVLPLDVADPKSRANLVHELPLVLGGAEEGAPGRLDLLINNAGVLHSGERFGHMEQALLEDSLRTNAIGPFLLTQALAPLLADAGTVANISSQLGSIANTTRFGTPSYDISKAAQNMGSVLLARALAERGIVVLALHPGWVQTEMGGAQAQVAPGDAVAGLLRVIDAATPAQSGSFLDWRGEALPW